MSVCIVLFRAVIFFAGLASCVTCTAEPVKRILIVGDSWAASVTAENRNGFPSPDVFDDALAANGLGAWGTQGKVTAWGGRKASDWAKEKHLAELTGEFEAHPAIDIVHLIIGGNDYLSAVNREDFPKDDAKARAVLWNGVVADIQAIVNHCLAVRPSIRVVIAGYDYLDSEAAEAFWKMNFHGATQAQLNAWFVELGEQKRALAEATDRCAYVDNWGTLQYWFGDPPKQVSLPGGDIEAPMPEGVSPDGIHPNAEAHAKLLQNAIDRYYKEWLGAPAEDR